jgi:flagellin
MALSIHTNYSSLITQTNLSKTNNALGSNQQRLGTGLRINSAADDAAGLQIATRLNAQSRGMDVAIRNTGDSISMLQTAEGAFNEMTDIVQRMKDLTTQGANGTNSAHDLAALQSEYNELGNELGNIIKNTKFAGDSLFSDGTVTDGSDGKFANSLTFQIGASSAETLDLDLSGSLTSLTTALTAISTNYEDGTTGVEIADVDLTTTPPTITANTANATIDLLETALNEIGSMRASFGANINRLNHTANNLANMKDNTDVSKGRIMDADFAKESANMSKNSMLMQSGISMLKQAGQMPGMVMSLLG